MSKISIKKNAQVISGINDRINKFYQTNIKRWKSACDEFHEKYDRLAFPGGLEKGLQALDRSKSNAIEAAVQFLEVNPYFFRSGYIKEKILTKLKNADLSKSQLERLYKVLLNIVDKHYCREFRYYCKLARKIKTQKFLKNLRSRMESSNKDVAKRARWMFDYVKK